MKSAARNSEVRVKRNCLLLRSPKIGCVIASSLRADKEANCDDAIRGRFHVHWVRRVATPNDPKLRDSGARHGSCVVGLLGAGAVTCVAVLCSAWLGVAGIQIDWGRALRNNLIGFAVGFVVMTLISAWWMGRDRK